MSKSWRQGPIKTESASVEEREAKIIEMAARGFEPKRTYEYERTYLDRVATGYKGVPLRNIGETSRKRYGAVYERVAENSIANR